jgi:hypothetical protein
VADSSKKSYVSKRAVLPMMMMIFADWIYMPEEGEE